MVSYGGKEPFVFLSYSHLDVEFVDGLIIGLKQKMCRVWYDEGLTPGESWNDELAERIMTCECVIAILTCNSCESDYVRQEINFAISKKKKIIPVVSKDTFLPPGLELMLSSNQFIWIDSNYVLKKTINTVLDSLPPCVFAPKKTPFLEAEGYSFYLEEYEELYPDSHGRHICADCFKIKVVGDNETEIIYDFKGVFAYDIDYSVSQSVAIGDDYFVGKSNGLYIINILANCSLVDEIARPYYAPDFSCLMIFSLRISENGKPTMIMIDYRYVDVDENKIQAIEGNSFSQGLSRRIEEKLNQIYNNDSTTDS